MFSAANQISDSEESGASTTTARTIAYCRRTYLPPDFDYFPNSLQEHSAFDETFSPGWNRSIEHQQYVHALQIAEDDLAAYDACENACPKDRSLALSQLACTYLKMDQVATSESLFSEAFEVLGPHKADSPECFINIGTMLLECRITLAKMKEVLPTLLAIKETILNNSLFEDPNCWPSVLASTMNYCLDKMSEASDPKLRVSYGDLILEIYGEALSFFKDSAGEDSVAYIHWLASRAEFQYSIDDIKSCAKDFHTVRTWMEAAEQNNGPDYARACLREAQCAIRQKDSVTALHLVRIARHNFDSEDSFNYAMSSDAYVLRAQVAHGRGQVALMAKHYESAIDVLDQHEGAEQAALATIIEFTGALAALHAPDREEFWLRAHLNRVSEIHGEDSKEALWSHERLCSFLDRTQQRALCLLETELCAKRCLAVYGEHSPEHIDALCEVANAGFCAGRGEQAELLLINLLAEAREHLKDSDRRLIIKIIETSSNYHQGKGEHAACLRERRIVERLARLYDGAGSLLHAQALLGLGAIYLEMDEYDLCEASSEKALQIFDANKHGESGVVGALEMLGSCRVEQGDLEGGELRLVQALETLKSTGGLESSEGVRILDQFAACICQQVAIIPDINRQRLALAKFVLAEQIQDDLDAPEGQVDALRSLHIQSLARELGFDRLAERSNIRLTRMVNNGLEIDGWGNEEGVSI